MAVAPPRPSVDAERLWRAIQELAEVGATEKGGVARIALTDLDRQGRDRFVAWARAAGCEVVVDRIGNVFAIRPGADPSRPVVLTGSHLDSQPTGGRFDGAYGVLAGLEVLRALDDAGVRTVAPVGVAVWTAEEGYRFPPMLGAGVRSGRFTLDEALAFADRDGVTVAEALTGIGYAGPAEVGSIPIGAYLEAHIEQGPVLVDEHVEIGIVQGSLGIRWFDAAVTGTEAHAGPTPMTRRRDALAATAEMVLELERIGQSRPGASSTVGEVAVHPNSRNVIPGGVRFTVDFRHPEAAVLDEMEGEVRAAFDAVAARRGVEVSLVPTFSAAPQPFDPDAVAGVARAAEAVAASSRPIHAGAGHDAVYLAAAVPTAMVFIPCRDGISHNEAEHAEPADVARGAEVLLRTVLDLAGTADG